MLETNDIQGLVLSGYASHPFAAYMFLSVRDKADVRGWLAQVNQRITGAGNFDRRRTNSTNIALTFKGFERFGLNKATLLTFPLEFMEGMSDPARAQMLGDDPDTWLWGKPDHRIHILLMLFAHDAPTLSGVIDAERQAARGILDELLLIHSQTFPVSAGSKLNHEHFGFVDGLSQPEIAGYRPERDGANGPGNDVSAGEFILGYSNEYFGQFTASPHLHPPDADPNRILRCGDLGRNGTYLVVRQMEQEVAGFWNMLRARCLRPDETPDPAAEEALAAKMFGRWRDGTPVTVSPDRDGGVLDRLNDFGFSRDAYGFNCPLGAHIRRANPRDTLLTDKKESITTVKRHRMIRRGRPYGPPVADRYSPDGQSRGLVFAALNANIERQFEFLQQAWISSPNFAGLYDEADPILGGRTENAGVFTMPRPPVRQRRSGIMSHVTVKGGAYFFMPGLAALRYLSDPGSTAPNASSNRSDAASGG
jgi:Dyp-type peroxidase family